MPTTLFDAEGNEVEVPDFEEIETLKKAQEEAEALRQQLEELEDGSKGVKSLRDALKRRDEKIQDLESKLNIAPEEPVNIDKIREIAQQEAAQSFLQTEKNRRLASLSDDERQNVERVFNKLTAGEQLNADNMDMFINQAMTIGAPERVANKARNATYGGGVPRPEAQRTSFADTEEGKDFAARLGMTIDKPNNK